MCVGSENRGEKRAISFLVTSRNQREEGEKVLFRIDRREQDRKHGFTCLFLLLFLLRFVAITRNFRFE